jgi:hypothetical protein
MKLTFDGISGNLHEAYLKMLSDDLQVGLVAYIGNTIKPIGNYFAGAFGCELVGLQSSTTKGKNKSLMGILNNCIYPVLPERLLKAVSNYYKKAYQSSERFIEKTPIDERLLKYEKNIPILLVDDNAFTGKTFELWKRKIKEMMGKNTVTFSVTVTGDYKPDYHCFDGWHSFKWRHIGI